jgi:S-methylmethionine-dependent homocysteine/selenocysteine methylase
MAKYRNHLPQVDDGLWLTDGGLETTLIFHDGFELPDFASFVLLDRPRGREALRRYFRAYAQIARRYEVGLVLETATWRASADWGRRLGYSEEELHDVNLQAVELLEEIRSELETETSPIVISGCLGPRGDGYDPDEWMSERKAQRYHATQVATFEASNADLVSAITMTYADEAIGIARAANAVGMPVVVSFTVETDGSLPDGTSLQAAVERVDDATDGAPAYYMINCAHPTHFEDVLAAGESWMDRIRGLRANASKASHAELDEAEELDAGHPAELGAQYGRLRQLHPSLDVLGGCCGTDERHVEAIAKACLQAT